ncbi:MAG TPA: ABC transporter ATP-binding protein [Bosea sp. (in: a-proteobacteria)]|jgi:putative ABC transport system ATP-binding protein|uniref:ABC transporter ATP-binding protein n=1 Tax=Bosea sp. (in: a-proteobacteria) TaxID=1871050 RepID=UPI002E1401FF|nr:ABC transporter ATP-binding protein [Bosea sp. (in: a-proteobacteria)]
MRAPSRLQAGAIAVSCRGIVKDVVSGGSHTRILHGIDLDVFVGEMTFLMGPSGCGKTTLISTIAGILPIEVGQVELLRTDLRKLGRAELARFRGANLGIVFQKLNLFPALTVTENVAVPLLVLGEGATRAEARANSLLDEVGLGAHLRKYPGQLSVGEQQRVAIARALVHEPSLVICDEPTAALDAASGQIVMELLGRVALRADCAVIVVTHDNRIISYADRVVHMNDGQVTAVEIRVNREAA